MTRDDDVGEREDPLSPAMKGVEVGRVAVADGLAGMPEVGEGDDSVTRADERRDVLRRMTR